MKQVIIFDNNGETFDRFTIIDKMTGDIYGASSDPFHPQGFGQSCGNVAWNYFTKTVGANYMRRIETEDKTHYNKLIKGKTKEIIKEFISEGNLGKVISFNTLPDKVKQYVKQVTTA